MDFDEYQKLATRTATFDGKSAEYALMYLGLGVTGEAGEIAEKLKKILRNDAGVISEEKRDALKQEIGDVLWYLSQLARVLEIPFSEAAKANIEKTADRAARGVIKSSGDQR
ncbi:MAG: nucleoside triphosphate pyrophosphohydrolase family protein [Minisyncoccia bacterium]